MNTEDVKEALLGLEVKTTAAKLRSLMPLIEQRVRDGVRHEDILAMLAQHGIHVQLNTFRIYLFRYRKAVAEGKLHPARIPPAPEPVSTGKAAHDKPGTPPGPTIRNPGDLAKLRTVDFDLDELADIGKNKEP